MEKGTKVRFTKGPLGLFDTDDHRHFCDEVVHADDTGIYEGEHPDVPGWHLVRVGELVCPVAPVHFTEA